MFQALCDVLVASKSLGLLKALGRDVNNGIAGFSGGLSAVISLYHMS